MFVRQCIVVGMTALVLLCPYLPCGECRDACGAGMVDAPPESPANPACCRDCAPDESPAPPAEPDCPLGGKLLNCFCGGAVVAPGAECPDVDHAVFELIPHGAVHAIAMPAVDLLRQSARAPDSGCHFPPTASGREIRDLVDSYLL